jgi:hypothetical protein
VFSNGVGEVKGLIYYHKVSAFRVDTSWSSPQLMVANHQLDQDTRVDGSAVHALIVSGSVFVHGIGADAYHR